MALQMIVGRNKPRNRVILRLIILLTFCVCFWKYLDVHGSRMSYMLDWNYARYRRQLNGSKLIVIWNVRPEDNLFQDPDKFFHNHNCPEKRCVLSLDRANYTYADAVVFVPILFRRVLPQRSHSDQVYVMYNIEPPTKFADYPFYKLRNQFNIVMSYLDHPDTDIHLPMGFVVPRRSNKTIPTFNVTSKTKLAAWVVSNCDSVGQRNNYVKELSKYIDIDVFGKCGTKPCNQTCFQDIEKQYKFYLAFEKTYCDQYVTEKMYRTLNLNLVPVAMGGANYNKLLPEHSFIDVSRHKGPRMLADYLKWLDNNDEAYLKYFDWKTRYNAIDGRNKASGFCKLCELLHNSSYPMKTEFDFLKYWNSEKICLRDTEERRAVHLE